MELVPQFGRFEAVSAHGRFVLFAHSWLGDLTKDIECCLDFDDYRRLHGDELFVLQGKLSVSRVFLILSMVMTLGAISVPVLHFVGVVDALSAKCTCIIHTCLAVIMGTSDNH